MQVVEEEAFVVVGLPVFADWRTLWEVMPGVWEQFVRRHAEIPYSYGEPFVDVSLGRDGDGYVQLVGTRVWKAHRVPAGMRAVEVPAQRYFHHHHVGPATGIAATFGAMFDHAEALGLATGEFKLDVGYTVSGDEREHDLFIGLEPAPPWRPL